MDFSMPTTVTKPYKAGAQAVRDTYTMDDVVCSQSVPRGDYSQFAGSSTPIVIDNGSYECRAGWATESEPAGHHRSVAVHCRCLLDPDRPLLSVAVNFRAIVGKPKSRKEGDPTHYVGRHTTPHVSTLRAAAADLCAAVAAKRW
jgi:hypothetical protein